MSNKNNALLPPSSNGNKKNKQQENFNEKNTTIQRSRSSKGEKQTPKRDSIQQAAVRQVLVGNSVGDGLWCYQKDNSQQLKTQEYVNLTKFDQTTIDPEIIKQSERIMNQKQKIINTQIESEMVNMLERKCGDLGIELEQWIAKNQNQNIMIVQLQRTIQQFQEENDHDKQTIQKLNNFKISLESQIESIKDLYNKSKREIAGLTNQLKQSSQENDDLKNKLTNLEKNYTNQNTQLINETQNMRERIEELEEETDELKHRLQIRGEIEKKVDIERYKQLNDFKMNKINETENKLEKMGKLLEENATMCEKLAESEVLRKRFMDKNQQAEKEIKMLQEQNLDLQKQTNILKKRINDLSVLKSSNNKIMEERIKKLSETCEKSQKEIESLKKVVSKYKKQKPQQQFEEVEELEEVEAMPQLFGI